MPVLKMIMGSQEFELEYDDTPAIPEDWVDLLSQLHPLTACVVWEILTNHVTPATISLAQVSPDYERYAAIQTIAESSPESLSKVVEVARVELDEIFADLIPNDPRRIIH
ncbi:MAG TPA: hypothetical protein VMT46_17215 [Anaerolineaceae bacterium]|nr:hypothetical protein [Anaerolineaceae bacterium]